MASSPDTGIILGALSSVTGLGMEDFGTRTVLDFTNLILPLENRIFYHIMMLIIGMVLVKFGRQRLYFQVTPESYSQKNP